ncbi:Uncharacterised protein [Kluyvera cryocrescens]|uniref:Uncharacterized protein n=1 Tax=Kluyvera cryocrescens TaxID=580 RepID=A0A485D1E0_KLUCR|nr:Uncharacterised protein [Kluyvera cryocrescens]
MTDSLFTQPQPQDRYRRTTDPVLQLENINVTFDAFRALTKSVAVDWRWRAALRDWPQRRGENHADGCHHRQNPTR